MRPELTQEERLAAERARLRALAVFSPELGIPAGVPTVRARDSGIQTNPAAPAVPASSQTIGTRGDAVAVQTNPNPPRTMELYQQSVLGGLEQDALAGETPLYNYEFLLFSARF